MTRSIIDIADMDCTKTSPCKNCYWHIQGIEKNRCVKICQRLKEYREGHEYNHLPWPELKDLQDIEEVEVCEICRLEGKETPAKVRGLCQIHYARWQHGRINHPQLGLYKRKTEDKIPPKNEKHKAKLSDTLQKKQKVGDSMPDIEKVPVKRNEDDLDKDWKKGTCVICKDKTKGILRKRSQTCAACYQAWNMGKIDHPTLGSFKPSLTKSKIRTVAIKEVYVDPPIPKPQKPKKRNRDKVFKIYMSKYPEIMQYITETAEKSLLPAKDIFVQLLSEAITARKES